MNNYFILCFKFIIRYEGTCNHCGHERKVILNTTRRGFGAVLLSEQRAGAAHSRVWLVPPAMTSTAEPFSQAGGESGVRHF